MVHAAFDALRLRTFDALVAASPEEATSLGLSPSGPPLSRCGPDGPIAEVVAHREVLAGLERLDAASMDASDQADRDVMERLARFRLHLIEERREHRTDLELSLLGACSTLHASSMACDRGSAFEWEQVAERADAIAGTLRAREQALVAGLSEGRAAQPELAAFFAERAIPWMAQALAAVPALAAGAREEGSSAIPSTASAAQQALTSACERAVAALSRHAEWIAREVVPHAGRASALDPAEHALRMELCWGITTPADDIEAEAEASVRAAHERVVHCARDVAAARGAAVRDLADASALLHELLGETFSPEDDLAGAYRAATARALAITRDERLFQIDDPESLQVELARGRPWLGGAVNWPAPLFAPAAPARVLLSPDPKAHPQVAVANLAVHEGLPGHGLESLAFRRTFGGRRAPVSMLGLHDDLMQATKWVGPMLRIEGHAVYVEELLLDHGLQSAEGALFVEACKALRAARVIADLDLHVHGLSLAQTAARLAERSLFPLAWAEGQAMRYLRVPLQCAAYHLGAREVRRSIEELRAREPGLDLAAAHARLFELGPIPPPRLGV
jgi:uncharacterized protein (DUF885 family)